MTRFLARRARLLAALAVVVVSVSAVGLSLTARHPAPASPAPSETPAASAPATTSPFGDLQAPVVAVDGAFDPKVVKAPTGRRPQQLLWFNDGIWWGILLDATSGSFNIERLDWATQAWTDTGTIVDERPNARLTVLWDGKRLVVASAGTRTFQGDALRIGRYSYDPKLERYTRDPDYPVAITQRGVDSPVIARDSTGRLWVAYSVDGRLAVNHTVGSEAVWGTQYSPPVDAADAIAGQVAIVPRGDRIDLVWTTKIDDRLLVASHRDADPDATWTETSTIVQGLRSDSAQLDARSDGDAATGRLLIVVRSSLDQVAGANPGSPQLVLVSLDAAGTWQTYLVGRVQDKHVRPLLLLDQQRRLVFVVATAPNGGGSIYYKVASLDAISFPSGLGTPLITSPTELAIDDATSTGQDVDEASGLVVLANDGTTGHYLHAALALGGPLPGTGTARPIPAVPAGPEVVLRQTFDPWPVGAGLPDPWTSGDVPQKGRALIAAGISAADRAARLVNRTSAGSVTACAGLGPIDSGTVVVDLLVAVSGRGASDTGVLTVRGKGGDLAAVRFAQTGIIAYYSGPTRVKTAVAYRAGTWYRIRVSIAIATKRYDLAIWQRGRTAPVLQVRGLRWRSTIPTGVARACVQTPPGVARAATSFDAVLVQWDSRR